MRRDSPVEKATLVAVGDLSLWPQSVGYRPVTTREADTWPAFVLVVGERRDLRNSPARGLLDLSAVARGTPIALATNRHLRSLGSVVDIRRVLQHVVVVRCPPAPYLAELADELMWSMVGCTGGRRRKR